MRAQILARLLERAGLVMISLVLLSGTFVAMSGKASATPASPPHDWSFYVRYPYSGIYPGSYVDGSSNAYTLGCNQGKYDSSHGDINSETFLDFGRQNGTGSISVFTGFSFSQAMIERYSENFAAGYWECTGADSSSILYLGIGTNTSVPSVVTTSAGATWAGTVNSVSNYNESDHASQQVVIRGANDIEPAWVSQASAINWVNGYQNAGGPLYEDFGSCDGCPTIATTGNGYPFGPCSGCSNWNQYGAWYVSWVHPMH